MISRSIPRDLQAPDSKRPSDKDDHRLMTPFLAVFVPDRDMVWVVLDFSRLVRLHVISRDEHWVKKDLEPGSQVSPTTS